MNVKNVATKMTVISTERKLRRGGEKLNHKIVIEIACIYVRPRCTMGPFSDSWSFCVFFLLLLFLSFFSHQTSENRAMMSFTAPFYRHEAQSTHKLKPIKIDFASAARCILKTLFLYIFLSLDASQKPALTR